MGGAYTITFDPERDPEGRSLGTRGARLLRSLRRTISAGVPSKRSG